MMAVVHPPEKRSSLITGVVAFIHILTSLSDLCVQIGTLAIAWGGARDAAARLQDANCINLAGIIIVVGFMESFKQVAILGIGELMLALICLAAVCELYRLVFFEKDAMEICCNSAPFLVLVADGVLQVDHLALAMVDFFVFSTDAKTNADALWASLQNNTAGKIVWCSELET